MIVSIIVLALVPLIIPFSAAKLSVISCKELNTINKIFSDITRQQNFTGFTVSSRRFGKRRAEFDQIFAHVLRTVTSLSTATCINERVNIEKFKISQPVQLTNNQFYRVSGTVPHVIASHKCLSVVLASVNMDKSNLYQPIRPLVHLKISHRSSKLLFVLIHHTNSLRLKNFLKHLFNDYHYDVEVLTICVRKFKFKFSLSFKVQQLHYFLNRYNYSSWRLGIGWFKSKTKNLHGYRLRVAISDKYSNYRNPLRKLDETITEAYFIHETLRIMNGSYRINFFPRQSFDNLVVGRFDIKFPAKELICSMNALHVKPNKFWTFPLLVPVIYDSTVEYDLTPFMKNITTILAITSIIYVWSRLSNCDKQTWAFLTILEMVCGNANARNPVACSETIVFLCVIAIGFFFGTDLTSGLTTSMFVREWERPLETLEQMRVNNLTLITTMKMKFYASGGSNQFFLDVVNSNISCMSLVELYSRDTSKNHALVSRIMRDILISKNTSCTTFAFVTYEITVPDTIKVKDKVQAKISNIIEMKQVMGWQLNSVTLFHEPFSEIYWKMSEVGIDVYKKGQKGRNCNRMNAYFVYKRHLEEIEKSMDDEDETTTQMVQFKVLGAFLICGFIFQLFILLLEVLVNYLSLYKFK